MSHSTLPATSGLETDYELMRPIGEGGMGRVYLARHRSSGAEVVIKLVRPDRVADPAFRRRFQAELRVMREFRHPHAVALLDAAAADAPQPFLALEYVPGASLNDLLQREGRLSPDRLGRLLGQLCLVLQAAHDRGILHRDLSAANLMVAHPGSEHESLKVMDFGLAQLGGFYIAMEKLQDADAGIGGGTPDYVCPEQIRGEPVDARGDVYSAGVVLYQALTGHLPFEAAVDVSAILLAHRDQPPPPFSAWGLDDVPAAIETVVQNCLAKFPAERPASAQALAEQYGAALGRPIVDAARFAEAAPAQAMRETEPEFDPRTLIDHFEAWMPEAVAVMKLRGFIAGVGGEVVESIPGVIRVRLRTGEAPAPPRSLWGWLRSPPAAPAHEMIELHLRKQSTAGRSLVDLSVIRPLRPTETPADAQQAAERCALVCRELRAYLMIGR